MLLTRVHSSPVPRKSLRIIKILIEVFLSKNIVEPLLGNEVVVMQGSKIQE